MGFIESYLRCNPEEVSIDRINDLLSRLKDEFKNIEVTSGDIFEDKKGLTKKISAFANSAGGLLIIGINENKESHEFSPVGVIDDEKHKKERLEDLILDGISPKIDGLRIAPIRFNNKLIFLVDVPQSETPPHMASDYRYYKRHNFENSPMEEYEVRDMFGRRLKPNLTLNPLVFCEAFAIDKKPFTLRLCLKNTGKIMAKYVNFTFKIDGAVYSNHSNYKLVLSARWDDKTGTVEFSSINEDPMIVPPDPTTVNLFQGTPIVDLSLAMIGKTVEVTYEITYEELPRIVGNFTITYDALFQSYEKKAQVNIKPNEDKYY